MSSSDRKMSSNDITKKGNKKGNKREIKGKLWTIWTFQLSARVLKKWLKIAVLTEK